MVVMAHHVPFGEARHVSPCTGEKGSRSSAVFRPKSVISTHWQVHESEDIEFCHDRETQEDAVERKTHQAQFPI